MKPRIAWQKWQPLKRNNEDDNFDEAELDFDESEEGVNVGMINQTPAILTAWGPVPINQINPLNEFNFWTGHANFHISEPVCHIINKTEGVEAFIVQSPYRFRIAVGKCFSPQEVTNRVAYNIGQLFNEFAEEDYETIQ
jgi:hypothetical protein